VSSALAALCGVITILVGLQSADARARTTLEADARGVPVSEDVKVLQRPRNMGDDVATHVGTQHLCCENLTEIGVKFVLGPRPQYPSWNVAQVYRRKLRLAIGADRFYPQQAAEAISGRLSGVLHNYDSLWPSTLPHERKFAADHGDVGPQLPLGGVFGMPKRFVGGFGGAASSGSSPDRSAQSDQQQQGLRPGEPGLLIGLLRRLLGRLGGPRGLGGYLLIQAMFFALGGTMVAAALGGGAVSDKRQYLWFTVTAAGMVVSICLMGLAVRV